MATTIGNVAINVSDLERSERFYVDVLGLEVLARIENHDVREVLLGSSDGGSQLMLAQHTAQQGPVDAGGGMWKVYLATDDAQGLYERAARRRGGGRRPAQAPRGLQGHHRLRARPRRPPPRVRPAPPLRSGHHRLRPVSARMSDRWQPPLAGSPPHPKAAARRPPLRTSAKAVATRAALIELAAQLFSTQGYLQTSIRDIARDANLTTGAIYGHFRNKAELLAEAISSRTATELEASALFGIGDSHVETLREISRRYPERRELAGPDPPGRRRGPHRRRDPRPPPRRAAGAPRRLGRPLRGAPRRARHRPVCRRARRPALHLGGRGRPRGGRGAGHRAPLEEELGRHGRPLRPVDDAPAGRARSRRRGSVPAPPADPLPPPGSLPPRRRPRRLLRDLAPGEVLVDAHVAGQARAPARRGCCA